MKNLHLNIIFPQNQSAQLKQISFDTSGGRIGRSNLPKYENNWVLTNDRGISKSHATIEYQNQNYYIIDHSANGIDIRHQEQEAKQHLGGGGLENKESIRLVNGDMLFIGQYQIEVRIEENLAQKSFKIERQNQESSAVIPNDIKLAEKEEPVSPVSKEQAESAEKEDRGSSVLEEHVESISSDIKLAEKEISSIPEEQAESIPVEIKLTEKEAPISSLPEKQAESIPVEIKLTEKEAPISSLPEEQVESIPVDLKLGEKEAPISSGTEEQVKSIPSVQQNTSTVPHFVADEELVAEKNEKPAMTLPFLSENESSKKFPKEPDEPLKTLPAKEPDEPSKILSVEEEEPLKKLSEEKDKSLNRLPMNEPFLANSLTDEMSSLPESKQPLLDSESATHDSAAHQAIYAFLEGAGLKPSADLLQSLDPNIMKSLGQAFQEVVKGMIELLEARKIFKQTYSQFGEIEYGDQTRFGPINNNALKYIGDVTLALKMMLEKENGYLSLDESIREGFKDLQIHQFAMARSLRSGLKNTLNYLSPEQIEESSQQRTILTSRATKNWEEFVKRYSKINSDDISDKELAKAYVQEINQHKSNE